MPCSQVSLKSSHQTAKKYFAGRKYFGIIITHINEQGQIFLREGGTRKCQAFEGAKAEHVTRRLDVHNLKRDLEITTKANRRDEEDSGCQFLFKILNVLLTCPQSLCMVWPSQELRLLK